MDTTGRQADTSITNPEGLELLSALPAPVVAVAANGDIAFANEAARRLHPGAVPNAGFAELAIPEQRTVVAGYLTSVYTLEEPGASRYLACTLQGPGGQLIDVAVRGARVLIGNEAGATLSLTDVTQQRQRETELQAQALIDSLTGLPNRRSILRTLQSALRDGKGCVVAVIDLDRFKLINDQLGHHAGDLVLAEVASALVRAVPEDATVARQGGDEFIIVMPGEVDASSLQRLESVRHIALSAESSRLGVDAVTASIGVTHSTVGTVDEILRQCDIAMYAAKVRGRAQVAVYGGDAAAVVENSQSLADLVASLRAQNEQLHLEARTDARTGLANSRALAEVESTVVGAPESAWASCAVIFVDVDRFGDFNHLYGDDAGDRALKSVADALRSAARKTDLVFRKGGEEFVMVLPLADPSAAERVAFRVEECIAELKIPHAEGPTGWLSALVVGVSVNAGETVAQAVVRAGNAAMRCKATGIRAKVLFDL